MDRWRWALLACAAAASVLGAASPAGAEGRPARVFDERKLLEAMRAEKAEALFRRALELVDEGKHGRACPMLEESQRIDPAMGTAFRLAECYQRAGRLAEAWTLFRHVADTAQRGGSLHRAFVARSRAGQLGPRIAVAMIVVPPEVAGTPALDVSWDERGLGRDRWGMSMAVDVGEHVITATAPGKRPFRQVVRVTGPGTLVEVSVPPLEDAPPRRQIVLRPEPTKPAYSGRRWLALGSGLVGVTGIVVAGVSSLGGGLATQGTAGGSPAGSMDASTSGAVAVAGASFGVAGLAAAGFLWLTDPRPATSKGTAIRVAPSMGPSGPGGFVGVWF
ncbi:tetratricopeptide repeat protein [Polyangium aurulentum]|uniref:tetratricopeptide repeat protein n=1 Tax=Polyangium aurulentum TaxID=2567896 RepID=UPI0010AE76DE|nr:tetratricopeptide repeat protein [Polyangium aurulentum]UQA56346.1 tetratricopeptide repeat protein [Polyangium aurulentum]